MNRYRPESTPRALALIAAISFTAVVLAGIDAEAQPRAVAALEARFIGEVTAHGPVYRFPGVEVTARRHVEMALPALIERAFGGYPPRGPSAAPPNA